MYFDTDDIERYEGTGLFGREKYVYKYRYRDLTQAVRELEKDIRSALHYCRADIQNHALSIVEELIDVYNKKVKEEIDRKISML